MSGIFGADGVEAFLDPSRMAVFNDYLLAYMDHGNCGRPDCSRSVLTAASTSLVFIENLAPILNVCRAWIIDGFMKNHRLICSAPVNGQYCEELGTTTVKVRALLELMCVLC